MKGLYLSKKAFTSQTKQLTHFISVFSSVFSHEEANSLITRHFLECKRYEHKTDCIVHVLKEYLDDPNLFFSTIASIIRLHSNAIEEKPQLLPLINSELKLLGLRYDNTSSQLELLENFEPYLHSNLYLSIDSTYLPDQFYKNIIQEINWCYSTRAYTATLILIRKMFENLTLDLLRSKFRNNPDLEHLYWVNKRFPNFNKLIQNLNTNLKEFSKFTSSMNKEVIDFLHKMRIKGNKSAHTIDDFVRESKLDSLKNEIEQHALLMCSVLNKLS